MTPRVTIEYRGNLIEVPDGESIVGRGISCRIRFNDTTVSRQHLRLHLNDEALVAEDLGSRNGSKVNARPLQRPTRLRNNDVITLGNIAFRVMTDDMWDYREEDTLSEDTASGPASAGREVQLLFGMPPIDEARVRQTCPQCRASVPLAEEACPDCGYRWRGQLPLSVTQELDLGQLGGDADRRRHARVAVDIPVVYESALLSFVSQARNISRGGAFLCTDLLDEVGTRCNLTLLADGAPPLPIAARVTRVVSEDDEGPWVGMGVEFTSLVGPARTWLLTTLRAAVDAEPAATTADPASD